MGSVSPMWPNCPRVEGVPEGRSGGSISSDRDGPGPVEVATFFDLGLRHEPNRSLNSFFAQWARLVLI